MSTPEQKFFQICGQLVHLIVKERIVIVELCCSQGDYSLMDHFQWSLTFMLCVRPYICSSGVTKDDYCN